MAKQLKNFLKGMGSVMDVAPPSRATRFIPRESDVQRLQGDWKQIGSDMTRVFNVQRHNAKPPHHKDR